MQNLNNVQDMFQVITAFSFKVKLDHAVDIHHWLNPTGYYHNKPGPL